MFEADQRRLFSQFEVREFCDNLVEGVVKALKDVSKIQKKSTTTRAPVARPSLFINEKSKEPDFMFDKEQTIAELTFLQLEHPNSLVLFSQDCEEKQFDCPYQGPLLDTGRPLDNGLGPIFDEEDELVPTFDEKAPSMTSINMENHLCFDPGTTRTPLTTDIQEHCEKLDLINFPSEMCVKISSQDVKRFGFDKVKEFRVSDYVFENMFNSFKVFEPDELLDHKRFQHDNGINSGFVLSFDQFLKHSKGFDHFQESLELDLQQPDFCARNSFDSFVFKENSFNLSCYRYALITANFFASTCALDEFMVKTLLEQKSLRAKTDFCCDSVLKSDLELLYSNSDHYKHDQSPRGVRNISIDRAYNFEIWRWKYMRKTTSKLKGSKMDLRSNPFKEIGNDVPLDSAPGKTDMHGLIMESKHFSFLGEVKMFEADQRRLFSQFEVREFCDNLVEGVVKALKVVSNIQKKSTTTRAPVAKAFLFINEKPKEPDFMFDKEQTIAELTFLQPEHPSSIVLFSQDFEEKPFDYPYQGPLLDTRRPLENGLGPIFDEEDELGPTFDEKAASMISINMENHLCFDPCTTPTPLTTDIQEHCEKLDLINFLSEMCVKISSQDVKGFGFDNVKEFRVSDYVFENMFNSFKVFEPDELLDQKRFQHDNGINSGFVLIFYQFLKHSKGFDHFQESLELDLQQPDFCARNSFDSFVFKENSFNLSCYRYALSTANFFASTCALDKFMVQTLLNCDITCHGTILVYNTYFDRLHDDLKCVLHVLGKETLVSDLNKYLSCTYDPGNLMFILSVQDKQDQSPRGVRNISIDRAYKFEIWRWKYLRKTTSKLQGSFFPKFSFTTFCMFFRFFFLDSFPFDTCKMDLRSNHFQERGNDVPLGSAPGKTDMHDLIMESSKDICSLFDSYLPNHEASTHEITWRIFSTQLRISSKKNQIKQSLYVTVMPFTNHVIFSSREFRPPEKLEMANLLSDETTTN
ncbi:hypothetical protein F2Q69_00052649 [Brassica cretica]|uniref:Uncharacterized protein n=1 Tax=Brassica cretica TaxID=69181 RepID=A0A8S9MSG4_BRACR|nr:hypothetical protein F2Q69_00052649 [Brassica cretica]